MSMFVDDESTEYSSRQDGEDFDLTIVLRNELSGKKERERKRIYSAVAMRSSASDMAALRAGRQSYSEGLEFSAAEALDRIDNFDAANYLVSWDLAKGGQPVAATLAGVNLLGEEPAAWFFATLAEHRAKFHPDGEPGDLTNPPLEGEAMPGNSSSSSEDTAEESASGQDETSLRSAEEMATPPNETPTSGGGI